MINVPKLFSIFVLLKMLDLLNTYKTFIIKLYTIILITYKILNGIDNSEVEIDKEMIDDMIDKIFNKSFD